MKHGMDMQSNIEFEIMSVMIALAALACLTALWFIHSDSPMHKSGNDNITVQETYHVYGANYDGGNFTYGGDENKTFSESYDESYVPPFVTFFFPYVDASPYVKTAYANYLGRTSASKEGLMMLRSIKTLRVEALDGMHSDEVTAFMSDGRMIRGDII